MSPSWGSSSDPHELPQLANLRSLPLNIDDAPHANSWERYQEEGVQPEHEASFVHELIAGAASFEAAKAYEDHVARNGKALCLIPHPLSPLSLTWDTAPRTLWLLCTELPPPPTLSRGSFEESFQHADPGFTIFDIGPPPNHQMAKELMAGFAGAFIDREVETKGLDFVDRERAKRQAQNHIEQEDESRFNY